MILVIDNYDSFTHNLVHLLAMHGEEVKVVRCDRLTVGEVLAARPRRLVLSPGPGRPGDRGIGEELVRTAPPSVRLLGVCLGHQAIATASGGTLRSAMHPIHGKTSLIRHDGRGLFRGCRNPMSAMRYHSLVVDRSGLPDFLEVTAILDDDEGTIMGLRHRHRPIEGIQFHPESFMTPEGATLIRNFLSEEDQAA